MPKRLCAIAVIWVLLAAVTQAQAPAQSREMTNAAFLNWLESEVWPLARKADVSRQTFKALLAPVALDLTLPGLRLPGDPGAKGKPRQQEFGSPGRYFRQKSMDDLARIGRQLNRQNARLLARVEAATGVPGHIAVAIWGRESGFGRVPINHDAFQVLATRGYVGPNTGYFTGELVAAMSIVERGLAAEGVLKSSWAGALGQPQFMPTSYLAYGGDGDGDGRIDIWRSDADSLMSIGRFLGDHGWIAGRDWGFEVSVPSAVSCTLEGPDQTRPIADWARLGVTRTSGRAFPAHELPEDGFLVLPAGTKGPAFIVTPNFLVLKRYNRSDLYALFIGNVGDRIAFGMGNFRAGWAGASGLYRSDVADIQRALETLGHDVGGADGLAGFRTRRAIGAWQESAGRTATCYPDKGVKAALTR